MTHGWLGRLSLLACLACFACAHDSEGSADIDREIEGAVRDEFSNRGLSGAKVRFVSDTLDRAEATCDSDGRFQLVVLVRDGVRFGTLEASLSGYATSAKHSVYFDGTTHTVDLSLRPKN